jgi:hypothetical protein
VWVLVVMDQFTRRIVGFGVQCGNVDGPALCRMFQRGIRRQPFRSIRPLTMIPSIGFISGRQPPSPRRDGNQNGARCALVSSLCGTTDRGPSPGMPGSHTLFWTTSDLEGKLLDFQNYYNGYRAHAGFQGRLPEPGVTGPASSIDFGSYRWQKHCRGLYQTPIAA